MWSEVNLVAGESAQLLLGSIPLSSRSAALSAAGPLSDGRWHVTLLAGSWAATGADVVKLGEMLRWYGFA